MSFDLGVMNCDPEVAEWKAARIYESLCRGEKTQELIASSAVGEFYRELTERWPEIDRAPGNSADNIDISPWSCALDHSDNHVLISCVWSKAEVVLVAVQQLARKHQLVVYDPQADEVILPE